MENKVESVWSRPALLWTGIWSLLVLMALITRPLMPIDETRYLSVAWEMWLRDDFLVPYLNGAPYSHKPPLMFWLFHLGWSVFGVNEWWPRLLPPLFALANLFLIATIAGSLWPDRPFIRRNAPLILLGSFLWTLFSTLMLFDMILTFFLLVVITGLLRIYQRGGFSGWLLAGTAIGLGVLAKGPVILMHTLIVAGLAPLWAGRQCAVGWLRWYAGLGGAVLTGALIALAWAVPAGIRGGEEYSQAIFWGQTANRIVESFDHARPAWWYLALLPVLLYPWLYWGRIWRGLRALRGNMHEPGVRFALVWFLPLFIFLSLISGKQAHYLVPILPAFALLCARGLDEFPNDRIRLPGAAILVGLFGLVLLILPFLMPWRGWPSWLSEVSPVVGVVTMLAGSALVLFRYTVRGSAVPALVLASVVVFSAIHIGLFRVARPFHDLASVSQYLNGIQRAGRPIIFIGHYHGQFQFLGRLEKPIYSSDEYVGRWFRKNPDGLVVTSSEKLVDSLGIRVLRSQPYRNGKLYILDVRDILSRN